MSAVDTIKKIAGAPFSWISDLFSTVGDNVKVWQEGRNIDKRAKAKVKTIMANVQVTLATAQLKLAETGQRIVADWDMKALELSAKSFKDEILLMTIWFPLVTTYTGAFITGFHEGATMSGEMIKAVQSLKQYPWWYQVIMLGTVANTFGLRWLVSSVVKKGFDKVKDFGSQDLTHPPQIIHGQPSVPFKIHIDPPAKKEKELCVVCGENEPDFDGITCTDCAH